MLTNAAEPFSDVEGGGIIFSAQPPGKKFRDISQLSGGEKSIASLALLFSMHACSPSPFFILDEVRFYCFMAMIIVPQKASPAKPFLSLSFIFTFHPPHTHTHPHSHTFLSQVDAALDAVNVQKVAAFIRERSLRSISAPRGLPALQFLVISLKDSFYSQADLLVGIYRDSTSVCSRRMTLDLSAYDRAAPYGGSGTSGVKTFANVKARVSRESDEDELVEA